MATGTSAISGAREERDARPATSPQEVVAALALALTFVFATRIPVMRTAPLDSDEFGFLASIHYSWLPICHTLFLASARALGAAIGDEYRGFLVLDMLASAGALVAVWWWLRAVVRPAVAAAATLVMGCAPVFWAYGAMAGNYTAIVLVGSFLLGVAARTWNRPEAWHPYAAAAVLAVGTGYRQDIGTFWLPVLLVIFWRHRWRPAIGAGALFTALNLAWLVPMIHAAGGLERYRAASAEFAHNAGYLNSVWNLGVVDAPLRYAVKAVMALVWTFGPGLVVVPRGWLRLYRREDGTALAAMLVMSVTPALVSHSLVHFGVPGYACHYVPAIVALVAIGIGRATAADHAPARLLALAGGLAAVFVFYPVDYDRPGLRGSFDLAFARQTRAGLQAPLPRRTPAYWRTANSQLEPGPLPYQRSEHAGVAGN